MPAVTPDPDSLLYNMYSSTVPGTWMSAEHLSDAKVDELLNAGRSEPDPAKRAEIYKQLNARLRELAPTLYLYELTGVFTTRDAVTVPALDGREEPLLRQLQPPLPRDVDRGVARPIAGGASAPSAIRQPE